MDIRRSEVFRYLGYQGKAPNNEIAVLTEECILELSAVLRPQHIFQVFSCEAANNHVTIGPMEIESKNLAANLDQCKQAILFAATLGTGTDFLLQRYSRMDMAKTVVLQAVAAATIEEYCDQCQKEIKNTLEAEGKYIRPRFSPGYGDFPLEYQKVLVPLLDCPRKIGLTLTDSCLLAPSKSVTAVMGISSSSNHCPIHGCEACENTTCQFRRE